MWLVQGPFDEDAGPGVVITKLLKPDTEYPCGRRQPKDLPTSNKIILAGKSTSRNSGKFIVGPVPENLNSDAILSYKLPEKDKPRVLRDGTDVEADSNDVVSLEGGDVIRKAVSMKVIHEVIYIYIPLSMDRDAARELTARTRAFGIRATRIWSPIATHYLIDAIPTSKRDSPSQHSLELLCGLVHGAHFVKMQWLESLLEKAERPRGEGNLEEVYEPPLLEDHTPDGRDTQLWLPSDRRQNLFKGVKFLALYDGNEPKKNFDALVATGGGMIQTYCISSEKAIDTSDKFANIIRRAGSKRSSDEQKPSTLVIIGLQSEVVQAHPDWKHVYLEGASDMDMRIVFEDDLALAILHADISYINCSLDHELPQHPSQKKTQKTVAPSPSPAPYPTAKVVKSTLNEQTFDPSLPPDDSPHVVMEKDEDGFVPPPPPRRRGRLATTRKALFGLEDDSIIEDAPKTEPETTSDPVQTNEASGSSVEPSTKASQSYPMARQPRRETPAARNRMSLFGLDEEESGSGLGSFQPVSKRFKAEFESNLIVGSSFPAAIEVDEDEEMDFDPEKASIPPTNVFPIPYREPGSQRRGKSSLDGTFESQSQSQVPSQSGPSGRSQQATGSKRKIISDDEEDTPMESQSRATQASKRRAIENVNAVVPTNGSSSRTGATQDSTRAPLGADQANTTAAPVPAEQRGAGANGIDTAPEFLSALATKKKTGGKGRDDPLDKEFGALRITAPDREREAAARARAEEMEVWSELGGKDTDLVGNFMVIVVSDDILRKDGGRKERQVAVDTGVPNFKRFKKKAPPNRAPPIELVADSTVAYGEGQGYWEQDAADRARSFNTDSQPRARTAPRKRGVQAVVESPSSSRSPSPAPSASAGPSRKRARDTADSDDEVVFTGARGSKSQGRAATATSRARKGKAKEPEPEEFYPQSDSDDEVRSTPAAPAPAPSRTRATRNTATSLLAAAAAKKKKKGGRALRVVDEDDELEDFGAAIAAIPSQNVDDSVDVDDNVSTMKSSGGTGAATTQRRSTRTTRAGSVARSEVSESQVATGTSTGTGRRKRAREEVVEEEDEDDGVAFKGFRSKRTRV